MSSYLLLGTIIWLYMLSVLKRARLTAYYFIVGSAGLFFVLMALAYPYWVWFFTHAVINGVHLFGELTGWATVLLKSGMVYVFNAGHPLGMTIDFECSGIIETCALVALIAFFPTYARREKVFYVVFGMVYIYLANVLRLIVIITILHFGGGAWFFMAHTVIGRLVFYVLVIALYYNIFTYSQLAQGIYRSLTKRGADA